MKTQKLISYRQFVSAGRPYTPIVHRESGRLLLPNFAINGDSTAVKHKRRLVISSGVLYNYRGLCCVWVVSVSTVGYRWRWLYWRGCQRITWRDLSWNERRAVCRAYHARREQLPIQYAPSRHYARWISL